MIYQTTGKVISTDPRGLKGDTTTWEYDLATGLELKKTYADGKGTVKTYDAYNNLATVTDARGVVATYSYDIPRGLLTGLDFSDDTPAQKFIYNFLGQLTAVQDASGERSISYDHYDQTNEEVQPIAGASYALQEHWDAYGRSTGYALLKDGASQCDASITYGTLGRIHSAGFTHEGTVHQFRYGYLAGSNLLQSLAMPNGVTLTQSYEEKRDLLTSMDYVRDNSLITQRQYSYDALGRPMTRDTRYPDKAIHHADSFTYNKRSELTGALLGEDAYAYSYDNIGNREIAQEAAEDITYDANALNQYTRISTNGEDFTPEYDADGNQTLIQTSTGIWHVTYNGQNRAIKFEGKDGHTVITCDYDYMGRRFEKKVTVDGAVTLHERYIYRGYLQIAALDMLHNASLIHAIIWDPTQEIATRPLAIRENGTWYTYGWDLTKNICELYDQEGFIRTIYTYSPYGQVTAEGDVTQPIQWSSEMHDAELGLVYYNYRYYNPTDGRWTRRDSAIRSSLFNIYGYCQSNPVCVYDSLGNFPFVLVPLSIVAASVLASCGTDVNIIPGNAFMLTSSVSQSTVPDPSQKSCGQYFYEISWFLNPQDNEGIGELYVREKKKIIIDGEDKSEDSPYSPSSMKQKISGKNYPNTKGSIDITVEAKYVLKENASEPHKDIKTGNLAGDTIGSGQRQLSTVEWDCRCPGQEWMP